MSIKNWRKFSSNETIKNKTHLTNVAPHYYLAGTLDSILYRLCIRHRIWNSLSRCYFFWWDWQLSKKIQNNKLKKQFQYIFFSLLLFVGVPPSFLMDKIISSFAPKNLPRQNVNFANDKFQVFYNPYQLLQCWTDTKNKPLDYYIFIFFFTLYNHDGTINFFVEQPLRAISLPSGWPCKASLNTQLYTAQQDFSRHTTPRYSVFPESAGRAAFGSIRTASAHLHSATKQAPHTNRPASRVAHRQKSPAQFLLKKKNYIIKL